MLNLGESAKNINDRLMPPPKDGLCRAPLTARRRDALFGPADQCRGT
jgi:hypothetical protein